MGKELEATQNRERAWRYLEKRMYEHAIKNQKIVKWTTWEIIGTGLGFYFVMFGGLSLLLFPPWRVFGFRFPLVGPVLSILFLIVIIEFHIRGENVRRKKANVPPPRFIIPAWPMWKVVPWWAWLVDLFVGLIVGYVLSYVLTPFLMSVVSFLGVNLGLDFVLPWDISILIPPLLLVLYILLRSRMLRNAWRSWWLQHGNTTR